MSKIKSLEELTILENPEIDSSLTLAVEQEAFRHEPAETLDGIKFLLEHGTILVLQDVKTGEYRGIAESISLRNLLEVRKEAIGRLPPQSPLRMVLLSDKQDYRLRMIMYDYPARANYFYAHGIAVVQKGVGHGTALFRERIKRLVGENDLMFGFVMASHPNIPSIRMYLRQGAVIDGIFNDVYGSGGIYFRVVYDKRIGPNPRVQREILLEGDYIKDVCVSLADGFIGTSFKQSKTLVFNRRL